MIVRMAGWCRSHTADYISRAEPATWALYDESHRETAGLERRLTNAGTKAMAGSRMMARMSPPAARRRFHPGHGPRRIRHGGGPAGRRAASGASTAATPASRATRRWTRSTRRRWATCRLPGGARRSTRRCGSGGRSCATRTSFARRRSWSTACSMRRTASASWKPSTRARARPSGCRMRSFLGDETPRGAPNRGVAWWESDRRPADLRDSPAVPDGGRRRDGPADRLLRRRRAWST